MQGKPKISIITPSKNSARFARETIESILAQTYKNWEHIIVDGVSTDETLGIIQQYPHIRLISEPDSGPMEALLKGLTKAKGEYVTLCCISDGYLDKNWLKRCADILDSRPEISLVWGVDQNMLEDGTLVEIICNSLLQKHPPNERDFIYYWLDNKMFFPERNLCVRKNVINLCSSGSNPYSFFCKFMYNFNTMGFLPYFIPVVAAYARRHSGTASEKWAIDRKEMEKYKTETKQYYRNIDQYKENIIKGVVKFQYRDGYCRPLSGEIDLRKVIEYDNENQFKKIISYLTPPILILLKNKLIKKYQVYQNCKRIRKDFINNSNAAESMSSISNNLKH